MAILSPQYSFPVAGYGSGYRVVPVLSLVLSAAVGAATVNLQQMPSGQQISNITTIYVDNSNGAVGIVLTFPDTAMQVDIPAFTQGFFPVMTGGLVFDVSAPLVGVLGGTVSPVLQVLNFAVPPTSLTVPPDDNAGVVENVLFVVIPIPFHVPGSGLIFTSLEVDNSSFPYPVTISSIDINGNAWRQSTPAFTKQETPIPPTAAGTIASGIAPAPPAGVVVETRWRVFPAGDSTSTTLPATFQSTSLSFVALTGGTDEQFTAAEPDQGYFVQSVSVYPVGVTQSFTLALQDVLNNSTFFAASFSANLLNPIIDIPINYTSFQRGDQIAVVVQSAAPVATCDLVIVLNFAFVNASQNG
jgi:hypothetical protein